MSTAGDVETPLIDDDDDGSNSSGCGTLLLFVFIIIGIAAALFFVFKPQKWSRTSNSGMNENLKEIQSNIQTLKALIKRSKNLTDGKTDNEKKFNEVILKLDKGFEGTVYKYDSVLKENISLKTSVEQLKQYLGEKEKAIEQLKLKNHCPDTADKRRDKDIRIESLVTERNAKEEKYQTLLNFTKSKLTSFTLSPFYHAEGNDDETDHVTAEQTASETRFFLQYSSGKWQLSKETGDTFVEDRKGYLLNAEDGKNLVVPTKTSGDTVSSRSDTTDEITATSEVRKIYYENNTIRVSKMFGDIDQYILTCDIKDHEVTNVRFENVNDVTDDNLTKWMIADWKLPDVKPTAYNL